MISVDEVRKYLPKYLSPESEKSLLSDLKNFPTNIDSRFYTRVLEGDANVFQGDGLSDLLVVALPDPKIGPANCIVISNTCDVDPSNRRAFPSSICYAPIFSLAKYAQMLERRQIKVGQALHDHILAVKRQEITQIFFLPAGSRLAEDSLVFLDRVCHCTSESVPREAVPTRRLFTLSNYGAWLFLFKLSVHFTRLTDGVDRRSAA